MNKVFIALAALTAAVFAAPAALAQSYAGVGVGTNSTTIESFDLDDGLALDAFVGTEVNTPVGPVRVEGAVARVTSETSLVGIPLNTRVLEYSATAYYDLPFGDNVRPYVGAGFNYTDGEASVLFTSLNASGTGYHLAGGFRTEVTDQVTFDAGVRWYQKDIELEAFGTAFDVDAEELRLRAGFSVAL